MKKFLIIASVLFLLLAFNAQKTYACSCIPPAPVEESLKKSTAVFSAEVISITENEAKFIKTVKLKLKKSWKGKLAKTLTITTGLNSAMCGYEFVKGKTYLIYANGKNTKTLSASLCSRTGELVGNKDVVVLDGLKKKP